MSRIYQVSTLQALALGYSKAVINVAEHLKEGDIGLGTFETIDARSEGANEWLSSHLNVS